MRVGVYPQFLAVDDRTHTVYVANSGSDSVSVIDGRDIESAHRIPVGPQPFTVAFNARTGSLYVTDLGAHTISVIDGSRCNATDVSGCRRRPATVNVGETPGGIAVDAGTNTIYVTGKSTNDVLVVDGRRCNAHTTQRLRQPVHVRAGARARHRGGRS